MGIIKHRPKISLLMQREIHPGGRYDARVVVEARREVPITWMRATISGRERATLGSGNNQHTWRRQHLSLAADLSGPRTIPAGRTELPFTFHIPAGLPPSYRGQRCAMEYTATIRASIPWWPDAKAAFDIFVSLPPTVGAATEPALFSSDPAGPSAREPHVEGSLASAVIEPGGAVKGALALSNVRFNDYSAIVVGLVATEHVAVSPNRRGQAEALRYGFSIPLEQPTEGASIPFNFRVPDTIPSTTAFALSSLVWTFDVRAKIRWKSDLRFRVPVTVVPTPKDGPSRRAFRAPPSVGSERIEKVWRAAAEETGLSYEPGILAGSSGEVAFRAYREHKGRNGVFLVGQLIYPDLHLGLCLEPRKGSLTRWATNLVKGTEPWDDRHWVTGRDPDQMNHMGGYLKTTMPAFFAVHMDDEETFLQRRGAGQRQQRLVKFVSAVQAFARSLDTARASIPPPRAMQAGLEDWREFAGFIGGSLETSRMAVTGHFHAMPVEVRTEWSSDGRAERTLLLLRPNMSVSADEEIRFTPSGDDPLAALADIPAASGPARVLLEAILKDAYAFHLVGDEVSLSLPAPLVDPTTIKERLAGLVQLIEMLRHGKGPFR